MFSTIKDEEMRSGCEERRLQEDAVAKQAKQGFSLCLRKFRWDCGNFAIIAKISQS